MKDIRIVIGIVLMVSALSLPASAAERWSAAVRPVRPAADSGARGPVLFRVPEAGRHQRPWQSLSSETIYRSAHSRRAVEPQSAPATEEAVEETVVIEEEPSPVSSPSPAMIEAKNTRVPAPTSPALHSPPPPPEAASYGKIPPYFIKNDGQLDPVVRYYVKGGRGTVYLTDTEVVFDFLREIPGQDTGDEEDAGGPDRDREERKEYERLVFRKQFVDSNPEVKVKGEEDLPGKINYFVGSRENWRSNIPTVEKVVYRGLYQGIDMEAFFRGGNPVFLYRIDAGSDPALLKFNYQGVDELRLKPTGELVVVTRFGGFVSPPPRAYQEIEGEEREIECSFKLREETGYDLDLGSYDSDYPLIIE